MSKPSTLCKVYTDIPPRIVYLGGADTKLSGTNNLYFDHLAGTTIVPERAISDDEVSVLVSKGHLDCVAYNHVQGCLLRYHERRS